MKDRREHPRYPKDYNLSFAPSSSSADNTLTFLGKVLDLSRGGARFQTGQACDKNAELALEIEVKELIEDDKEWQPQEAFFVDGLLKIKGKVMWCEEIIEPGEYEIGVRFMR